MSKPPPLLKRSSSSFFSSLKRRKATSTYSPQKRARTESSEQIVERLQDVGPITSMPPCGISQDVLSLMHHARQQMFDEIPERAAGMNSVRIAEVLNHRRALPPIVSLAHVYALCRSPTEMDREIAKLVSAGTIRRTAIMGRGKGIAPLGEGLVIVDEWRDVVKQSAVGDGLQTKYLDAMDKSRGSITMPASAFLPDEVSDLMAAGLVTYSSPVSDGLMSRPGAISLCGDSVALAGTIAATGTLKAVGGESAVHNRGGGGAGLPTNVSRQTTKHAGDLLFALPGTGMYLRLVTEARQHALDLLSKASPKFKESTKTMFRERWNGGVMTEDAPAAAKKARGEWTGVAAGRTKRWTRYDGMCFDWILEELLGSGAVECFNTGSVGLGVRVSRS